MEITLLFGAVVAIIVVALIVLLLRSGEHGSSALPAAIAGVAVVVILLGSTVMPAILGEESEATMEYDEYLEVPYATDVSGNLEYVTIDGSNYIHATDVGEGSYKIGTTTYNTTIEKADLDVWIIAGQSNSAYFIFDTDTATETSPGTSYYYGTPYSAFVYGPGYTSSTYDQSYNSYSMQSLNKTNGEQKIGHLESAFQSNYYELTGTKSYTVNVGIPSLPIRYCVPDADYGIYESAVSTITHALDEIDETLYTPTMKGMIWIQGESDASLAVSSYKTLFLEMWDAITAEFSIDTCLISKVRVTDPDGTASSRNAINSAEAQEELAEENDGIYLATSLSDTFTVANGLMKDDNLHYSQLGFNLLGKAIAEYYSNI